MEEKWRISYKNREILSLSFLKRCTDSRIGVAHSLDLKKKKTFVPYHTIQCQSEFVVYYMAETADKARNRKSLGFSTERIEVFEMVLAKRL